MAKSKYFEKFFKDVKDVEGLRKVYNSYMSNGPSMGLGPKYIEPLFNEKLQQEITSLEKRIFESTILEKGLKEDLQSQLSSSFTGKNIKFSKALSKLEDFTQLFSQAEEGIGPYEDVGLRRETIKKRYEIATDTPGKTQTLLAGGRPKSILGSAGGA